MFEYKASRIFKLELGQVLFVSERSQIHKSKVNSKPYHIKQLYDLTAVDKFIIASDL